MKGRIKVINFIQGGFTNQSQVTCRVKTSIDFVVGPCLQTFRISVCVCVGGGGCTWVCSSDNLRETYLPFHDTDWSRLILILYNVTVTGNEIPVYYMRVQSITQ